MLTTPELLPVLSVQRVSLQSTYCICGSEGQFTVYMLYLWFRELDSPGIKHCFLFLFMSCLHWLHRRVNEFYRCSEEFEIKLYGFNQFCENLNKPARLYMLTQSMFTQMRSDHMLFKFLLVNVMFPSLPSLVTNSRLLLCTSSDCRRKCSIVQNAMSWGLLLSEWHRLRLEVLSRRNVQQCNRPQQRLGMYALPWRVLLSRWGLGGTTVKVRSGGLLLLRWGLGGYYCQGEALGVLLSRWGLGNTAGGWAAVLNLIFTKVCKVDVK